MDFVRELGLLIFGGGLAVLGSIISENRRARMERQAWERSRLSERVQRAAERQRAAVENLQDLAYDFHNHVESGALFAVQHGAAATRTNDWFRRRNRGMIAAQDRSRALLDRLEDQAQAATIRDYFAGPWSLRIMQEATSVIDGPNSIGKSCEAVAAILRETWAALDKPSHEADGS